MKTSKPSLLRIYDVQSLTGLSRSVLYRLIAQSQFPAPIQLSGRAKAWVSDEVDEWIHDRIRSEKSRHANSEAPLSLTSEPTNNTAAAERTTRDPLEFSNAAKAAAARVETVSGADRHREDEFRVLPPSVGIDANWHVTNVDDTCVAHCFGFFHNTAEGRELALRIAACLNFCRGVSTEKLAAPGGLNAVLNRRFAS